MTNGRIHQVKNDSWVDLNIRSDEPNIINGTNNTQ